MNRKGWGIGLSVLLILGILGYGFLTRGGARPGRPVEAAGPTETGTVVPSLEPGESLTSSTLPALAGPKKTNTVFQIRVLWLDTNQPVEGATVTLIPEPKAEAVVGNADKPEPGNKPKNSDTPENTGTPKGNAKSEEADKDTRVLTGLTDKTGTLSLECPPDLATTGTLRCREIKAEYPGAVPVFRRGVALTVPQREPLCLFLPKAYGYFGTVYRRDAAGNFVPAPGARVSALSSGNNFQDPFVRPTLPPPAVCDDQGRYEISSLPDNVVYLWGQWDDQVTVEAKTPVMGKPGERSGPFDLYLEQGASVTALVSDKETLQPIPGATVEVKFARRQLSRSATADSEGFCEVKGVPLGLIEIFARAEGYADESSPMIITSEGNSNTVPFFLDKGSRVRILTVQGESGMPAPNVPLFLHGNEMVVESVSDSTGIALVEGLRPNVKWEVRAGGDYRNAEVREGNNRPEFVPEVQKTVEVTVRVADASPASSRHDTQNCDHVPIEGVVVNESGEPVPGAIVEVNTQCCHSKAVTDSSGEFHLENACIRIYLASREPFPDLKTVKETAYDSHEIDLRKPENYLPRPDYVRSTGSPVSCYVGPATLSVQAKGYASVKETVPIDRKARIVLKDKADTEVRIRVLDSETKEPITDYWYCLWVRVCSRDGVLVLKDVSPGTKCLHVVQAEGYVEKRLVTEVSRNPEENQIEILLDRQRELTGLVVDAETQQPLEGIEVRYTETDIPETDEYPCDLADFPGSQNFLTDSKGEFQFSFSKPRSYLIFLSSQYAQLGILLDEIGQYRNPESGKIVIPLEKYNASVSATIQQAPGAWLKQNLAGLHRREEKELYGKEENIPEPRLENGSYRWEGIPAGEYTLSYGAYGKSASEQDRWWVGISFRLRTKENRVFRIEENYSARLSGRLLGPDGATRPSVALLIKSESEQNGEQIRREYVRTSDENGHYEFDQIVPGTYKIMEPESRRLLETIQVNGDTQKDLTLPK
jgi:protocatechuate 3,4-dioxygenase beta subunit